VDSTPKVVVDAPKLVHVAPSVEYCQTPPVGPVALTMATPTPLLSVSAKFALKTSAIVLPRGTAPGCTGGKLTVVPSHVGAWLMKLTGMLAVTSASLTEVASPVAVSAKDLPAVPAVWSHAR